MEEKERFPQLDYTDRHFIALGTFDGVHIGHKKIIKTMVSEATSSRGTSFVVTFSNHPRNLLRPCQPIKLLTSPALKEKLIRSLGVDFPVFLDFNSEMAAMDPLVFVRKVLVDQFKPSVIYVGYNYTFGYQGIGCPHLLEKFGRRFNFKVMTIPAVCINGIPVSSTQIRKLLAAGDVERVYQYLGHYPAFQGEVVHGSGLGRTLGYPTANLLIGEEMQLPIPGVYFGKAEVNDSFYDAVANIGSRPTVNGDKMCFEVHLLNFNDSLYGRQLTFHLKKRIRDEKKFSGISELRRQIAQDIASVSFLKG